MTRQTFYRNLKKYTEQHKIKWRIGSQYFGLDFGAKIRCDDEQCPISFVANCKINTNDFHSGNVWRAMNAIGLSEDDAGIIVSSADRDHFDKDFKGRKEVRAALLRATNLG